MQPTIQISRTLKSKSFDTGINSVRQTMTVWYREYITGHLREVVHGKKELLTLFVNLTLSSYRTEVLTLILRVKPLQRVMHLNGQLRFGTIYTNKVNGNKLRTYRIFKQSLTAETYIKHPFITRQQRRSIAAIRCGSSSLK